MNPEKSLLGVYGPRDVTLVRGEGSYVWDAEGRKYLDCVSGVAVNALGHGHPAVTEAIREQLGKFLHASNLYVLPTQRDLAARLTELSGFSAVFFSNSGTEANEGAFKFARKYFSAKGQPERFGIVSFSDSFHGRTYASLAATGQPKMWDGFGPLPAGFTTVAANDVEALKAVVGPNTAAILYEPVQAEGGVVNMKPETAAALRAFQEQGVLLIADEIQTGLWRTGTFLGSEALLAGEGLKPDLVTLAKPLGGGLPLGAILLSEKIAAALKAGDHGSTFGGNPVACAAGLAVVEVLSNPEFQKDYHDRIALLRDGLETLIARKAAAGLDIGALRGRGFLIGFQYKGRGEGDGVPALQKRLRDAGVLAHRAGADVLRLLPPLTFSRAEIAELLAALDAVL